MPNHETSVREFEEWWGSLPNDDPTEYTDKDWARLSFAAGIARMREMAAQRAKEMCDEGIEAMILALPAAHVCDDNECEICAAERFSGAPDAEGDK